jgi:hypothetical protein
MNLADFKPCEIGRKGANPYYYPPKSSLFAMILSSRPFVFIRGSLRGAIRFKEPVPPTKTPPSAASTGMFRRVDTLLCGPACSHTPLRFPNDRPNTIQQGGLTDWGPFEEIIPLFPCVASDGTADTTWKKEWRLCLASDLSLSRTTPQPPTNRLERLTLGAPQQHKGKEKEGGGGKIIQNGLHPRYPIFPIIRYARIVILVNYSYKWCSCPEHDVSP